LAPFFADSEESVGSEILTPRPFLLESFEPFIGSKYLLYFDSKPDIP
jgi:hypothetical protein